MRTVSRLSATALVAAIALATGILFGIVGWLEPHGPLQFSGLILAAILTSAFAMEQSSVQGLAAMRPLFVIEFISLLLFGPGPTMLVAAVGTVTAALVDSQRPHLNLRTLLNAVVDVAAVVASRFGISARSAARWDSSFGRRTESRLRLLSSRITS